MSTACEHESLFERYHSGALEAAVFHEAAAVLHRCPSCAERLAAELSTPGAQAGLEAMDRAAASASLGIRASRSRRARRWLAIAATLVVGSLLAAVWYAATERRGGDVHDVASTPSPPLQQAPRPERWRSVNVPVADYTAPGTPRPPRTYRGGASQPVPTRIGGFERAMRSYQAGDYDGAVRALRPLAAKGDDPRASFYLGVSLLLLDRTVEALPALDLVDRKAPAGLRDQARYYLALAHLRLGDPARALPFLESAAASPQHFASDAARLLAEVRAAGYQPKLEIQ
jgi:tetratricopeptide (TPR) repeat protein